MVVSAAELAARDRAALFALLAEARPLSNPELADLIGFRLDGARRRRLNELGLVASERRGRAYAHELTEAGWRLCAAELAAPATGRDAASRGGTGIGGTGIERALQAVIGGIGRSLEVAGLSLADVLAQLPATAPGRQQAPRRPEYRGAHRGKPRDIGWAQPARSRPEDRSELPVRQARG